MEFSKLVLIRRVLLAADWSSLVGRLPEPVSIFLVLKCELPREY